MRNSTATATRSIFYIVAHPDDWIYFTSSIFYDVQNAGKDPQYPGKLVIVYVTSGDAGRTDGWWQAREEGAKAATRFLTSISGMRNSSPNVFNSAEWQNEAGSVYKFGVTTSHFLRIPDTSVQSLLDGNSQTTLDGRMRYGSKENLYEKLLGIIEDEREGGTNFHINTLSDRTHDGTQENIDHIAVGKAIREIVNRVHRRHSCTAVFWHAYSNANKKTHPVVSGYSDYPENVASHDYFDLLVWKAMALGAYSAKIQESFPSENGVHLYLSESEQAESVQWLSHMCIDYVFPENQNIDHFYEGCLVDT